MSVETTQAAPICAVHHSPMKHNSKGWFCPRKQPDGSWCDQRARDMGASAPAVPASPSGTVPAPASAAPWVHATDPAAAALSFAAGVYHGTGDIESAIQAAVRALVFLDGHR